MPHRLAALALIGAARGSSETRGFTDHFIEYALGRPFGFTDEDLANGIVKAAKARQYAISQFVLALVSSDAFRTK